MSNFGDFDDSWEPDEWDVINQNEADDYRHEGDEFDDRGDDDDRYNESAAEDGPDDGCTSPTGHRWVYTGTAYGGDDERWHGEGRCYCEHCGADGDA
jgi:hypothetical protein